MSNKTFPAPDPYAGLARYCKFDGKILISSREVKQTLYDENTGEQIEKVQYKRYCEDWQGNRTYHTETYSGVRTEIKATEG